MSTAGPYWTWSLAILVLGACTQSFGRLEGVLVDEQAGVRPLEPGETGRVEVTREGKEQQGRPNMALQKGDALITGADGVGVMVLVDGYRVIMDPGTDLTIENPSIFVRVGRIIVKKIKEVKEALTVKTELGAAAVEGTEFVLEVSRQQEVQLTVLEGRVKVYPNRGVAWRDTLIYVGGERGRLDSTRMARLPPLSMGETDVLRRRIRRVETTVRPQVPDLRGLPEAEARAELERLGLLPTVVYVITQPSQPVSRAERRAPYGGRVRVGTVVTTSPAPGAHIKLGARVRLSVEEESVAVPNLMGQHLGIALRILNRVGLRMGDTVSKAQPNAREGTVTDMTPRPGSYVRPGTRIGLTFARPRSPEPADTGYIERGRVPPDIDRRATCTVPNLMRLTERQALEATEAAHLVARVVRYQGERVTTQTPEPGVTAACGSEVLFTIGKPSQPNGAGQPR